MDRKVFHGLDVVRTLLAISVALGHFFYWNGVTTHFPRSFFVAVDFFFVLSGFVLTQSIVLSKEKNFESFLMIFITKRILRLYPLYLVVFIVSLAIFSFNETLTNDSFFYYFTSIFLLQSLGFDSGATSIFADTSIGISWSLSVEFWIGAIFFPIVFLLKKKPVILFYVSILSAISITAVVFNATPSIDVNFQRLAGAVSFATLRGWIGFSCGSAIYIAYSLLKEKVRGLKHFTFIELMTIILLICALYVPHDHRNEFISAFLFSFVMLALSFEKGFIGLIITHSIFSSFRYTSYSIYLIHPLVIFLWRKLELNFSFGSSVIYIIIVYLLSIASFKLVEMPVMKLRKKNSSNTA